MILVIHIHMILFIKMSPLSPCLFRKSATESLPFPGKRRCIGGAATTLLVSLVRFSHSSTTSPRMFTIYTTPTELHTIYTTPTELQRPSMSPCDDSAHPSS